MYRCIILHNIMMIIEARRYGYQSKLFNHAVQETENGLFVHECGNEEPFRWRKREQANKRNEKSDIAWERRLHMRENEITDKMDHFSLKNDLVEHLWDS